MTRLAILLPRARAYHRGRRAANQRCRRCPSRDPSNMPANAACRKTYAKDICARSLEILNRTVMVATHPEHGEQEIADIIHNIGVAARVALGGLPPEEADLRRAAPVDAQKFDLEVEA